MRLTLRTLLAYLDDLLKPAEAREIGRRLSESEGAGAMAGRIRDVLRRRRIAAPPVDGQPDANVVAEYLDNLLPDADVENHERTCLASDEALAETAAAHQILSLVMGKPVQVSDSLRERAYAVGPDQDSVSAEAASVPPARTTSEPDTKPTAAAPLHNTRNEVSTMLAKDRERSWGGWLAGGLACVAGVVLFAFLFSSDDAFRPSQRTAVVEVDRSGDVKASENVAPDANEAGTGESAIASLEEMPGNAVAAASDQKTAPKPAGTDTTVDDKPPAAAVASQSTKTSKAEMTEPATTVAAVDPKLNTADQSTKPAEPTKTATGGDAATSAAPVTMAATDGPAKPASEAAVDENSVAMSKATPNVPTPPEPKPSVDAAPVAPLMKAMEWQQSGEGLALHRDPIIDGWTTLPPRSKLFEDERLVIPEPFESTLRTDAGPLSMRFLANTDVHILAPTSDSRGGLEIVAGQTVIKSMADDAAAEPVPVMFLLGGKSVLAKIGAGAELAIEVTPTPPDKIQGGQTVDVKSVISVITGLVGLELVPAGGTSRADNAQDAATADDPAANGPRVVSVGQALKITPFEATPAWAIDSEPSTLTRRYGTMYRNLLPDEQPLVPELTAILNEPTYRMSELAAATLSMLGNAPGLVAALGSVHEETRRRSITGLRRWLADDPTRIDELVKLLSIKYRSDTVDVLVELLAGYSIDDLRRPSVSQELISHLEDSEIAVRETAFFDLARMTEKTFDYQPNGNSQSRGVAVRRWRDYVARDGALLTPVIEDEAE